jgi:hypothetical protein
MRMMLQHPSLAFKQKAIGDLIMKHEITDILPIARKINNLHSFLGVEKELGNAILGADWDLNRGLIQKARRILQIEQYLFRSPPTDLVYKYIKAIELPLPLPLVPQAKKEMDCQKFAFDNQDNEWEEIIRNLYISSSKKNLEKAISALKEAQS